MPDQLQLGTFRILDPDVVQQIKSWRDKSLTQGEITKLLNKNGYRDPSGRTLSQKQVSIFMIANGLRMRVVNSRGKESVSSSFLNEVRKILDSNLANDLKEKFIRASSRGESHAN